MIGAEYSDGGREEHDSGYHRQQAADDAQNDQADPNNGANDMAHVSYYDQISGSVS